MISPLFCSPENISAAKADQALKQAVAALEQAEHSAVTWFGEILRRELYRPLGHSSIYQYAEVELKWSRTRTGDFIRLARKLETLPAVKEAMARGELGYTKARELIKVATPRTQDGWVETAKSTNRGDLARTVKRVQEKARKRRRRQCELVPEPKLEALAATLPVRLSLEFTPEQFARYESLIEKLYKLGGLGDKAEALLQGLGLLVEQRGTLESATDCEKTTSGKVAPRGASTLVHVHLCPECQRSVVVTSRGDLELGRAEREKATCDAQVIEKGKRSRSVIPPGCRREVLARDGHRCRAPGCRNTRFLEVHHLRPQARGGDNDPSNLITLCSACHRLWHERPAAVTRIPSEPRR